MRAIYEAKVAAASKALQKASERAKTWEDNAARLRKVLTDRKPDAPTSCVEAWSTIRQSMPNTK